VNAPIKCQNQKCRKPIIPKHYLTFDGDKTYVLCPYCQSVVPIPVLENENNAVLKEWNKCKKEG
jgi:uncharacterized radical SAM superfamily Fe-S cluster-containing enzyme